MRAFFADGVDNMRIPWAVEGLPMLLHLSVFLFFGGVVIFLFNIDHAVFSAVIWWIGLFSIVYGLITVTPIIRHDSPYYAPLSRSAWFLYSGMKCVLSKALFKRHLVFSGGRLVSWEDRCHAWMLGGVEKAAEDTVFDWSSDIDTRIFDWTIGVLGDDDSLEKFFEAIPGFFNSKLVKHLEIDFPKDILNRFWSTLDGFMKRTLSSNLVMESVKARRVNICKDIMSMIPCPDYFALKDHCDQVPVSMERLQAMARWRSHQDHSIADRARVTVAQNLTKMPECYGDDDWIALASNVCGIAAPDLRDNTAHGGDNVLLATLIHVSRRAFYSRQRELVTELTQFDIRNTLPGLQHDFCALWNELSHETRNQGRRSSPVQILHEISGLWITLHQGTHLADSFVDYVDLSRGPLCDLAGHRTYPITHAHILPSRAVYLPTQPGGSLDASGHRLIPVGSAVPLQIKEAHIIPGSPFPPDPTTPSEIGDSSQATAVTSSSPALPAYIGPRPTDALPPDISSALTLSYHLDGTTQRDIVAPCAEPVIGEILSTASSMPAPTSTLAPVPASRPPVLNKSLTSLDSGAARASHPLLSAASAVGFTIPASTPPSHVPPLPITRSMGYFTTASPQAEGTVPLKSPTHTDKAMAG